VTPSPDPLPTDLAAAHAMIVAQREMLRLAQSDQGRCGGISEAGGAIRIVTTSGHLER
jgi:hypothetical protein